MPSNMIPGGIGGTVDTAQVAAAQGGWSGLKT